MHDSDTTRKVAENESPRKEEGKKEGRKERKEKEEGKKGNAKGNAKEWGGILGHGATKVHDLLPRRKIFFEHCLQIFPVCVGRGEGLQKYFDLSAFN